MPCSALRLWRICWWVILAELLHLAWWVFVALDLGPGHENGILIGKKPLAPGDLLENHIFRQTHLVSFSSWWIRLSFRHFDGGICMNMWYSMIFSQKSWLVVSCFRQRTENRARKRTFFASVCSRRSWRGGVGWGGVGWTGAFVNVPCASSSTCCYTAQMSGSVASLYTWRGGVGWGGVEWRGAFVNVPCASSATCCYAAQMSDSVASLYTWRGGVGGGAC